MATVKPFRALRPDPKLAAQICELPYDVMSSDEARTIAAGNPLSFLHVSKPEIDLPESIDVYDPQVYARGAANFQKLQADGALRQDPTGCFYLYRQIMGSHSQVGLVATASCADYNANIIKKHEFTRPDKEDDRVRHIEALNSQTGPVFLTFRTSELLNQIFAEQVGHLPATDFTAADGVRHTAWVLSNPDVIQEIECLFAEIPTLYIADGHHRSAAAARVCASRGGSGHSAFFLAVIFPHTEMQILPYNRVLKDLHGHDPAALLEKLDAIFVIKSEGRPKPERPHEVSFFMGGIWRSLFFRPHFAKAKDPFEKLDVTLLQKFVLGPVFGIDDPRTSTRIQFVGGIRGTDELEKRVQTGGCACAFSMYPTRIEDLMAIADAGGIMPPKSTWFEPKLRDAMFCHMLI